MPPSLLVSARGELMHAFGGASRFLRVRDGRQALDVVELVENDLKLLLVRGLKRALKESTPIHFNGVRLAAEATTVPGNEGKTGVYQIAIRRVSGQGGGPVSLLISFVEVEERTDRRRWRSPPPTVRARVRAASSCCGCRS